MFAGVVEEVGCVSAVRMANARLRLTIATELLSQRLHENVAVAVNGIRLRVDGVIDESFSAEIPAEAWGNSSFNMLRAGCLVNLEVAKKPGPCTVTSATRSC